MVVTVTDVAGAQPLSRLIGENGTLTVTFTSAKALAASGFGRGHAFTELEWMLFGHVFPMAAARHG